MKTIDEDKIIELWNMVFNLSLNMLHSEADAEDTTQNIFIKVLKGINDFKGRSSLNTWVYKIAYNQLLDRKRKDFKDEISFDLFERDVNFFTPYINEYGLSREEERIYSEQVKIGCTLAMLQCLDPESRFIFILGNIFCFPGADAAEICGISESAYRKNLSRSRTKIRNFMNKNCGLVNKNARCRCRKRLSVAVERGRINLDRMLYQTDDPTIGNYIQEMNEIEIESDQFHGNPFFDRRELFYSRMKERYQILIEKNPTAAPRTSVVRKI